MFTLKAGWKRSLCHYPPRPCTLPPPCSYSLLCSELASQGYLVLALEHLDGSASVAKLPGGAGWRWYGGLGDEAAQASWGQNKWLGQGMFCIVLVAGCSFGGECALLAGGVA